MRKLSTARLQLLLLASVHAVIIIVSSSPTSWNRKPPSSSSPSPTTTTTKAGHKVNTAPYFHSFSTHTHAQCWWYDVAWLIGQELGAFYRVDKVSCHVHCRVYFILWTGKKRESPFPALAVCVCVCTWNFILSIERDEWRQKKEGVV